MNIRTSGAAIRSGKALMTACVLSPKGTESS